MDSDTPHGEQGRQFLWSLTMVGISQPHRFIKPVKRINDGRDVPRFLTSRAYVDIGKLVMQLNLSMCPRKTDINGIEKIRTWGLNSPDILLSEPVKKIQGMLEKIGNIIEEAPPDKGPRRFGNISFRKWYQLLESRVADLLQEHLPTSILDAESIGEATSRDELYAYLLGSFGSSQRLDYGTGHELSFLAFLGCIWKLGGFSAGSEEQLDGALGRSIVVGIIEPYLRVIRKLILTYTLEPAGSHGVWGLDDHSFLPYIFGSAQYCPPIEENDSMPTEGSLPDAPKPGDITKKNTVDRERATNMYFAAVGFINDVKTGPFWEHSPMLFDISGVKSGWGKINKGMIKMYNAEVLSKFPVVQHFPFGSLFSWDEDPTAPLSSASIHSSSHAEGHASRMTGGASEPTQARSVPQEITKAPWAVPTDRLEASRSQSRPQEGTKAPWAR